MRAGSCQGELPGAEVDRQDEPSEEIEAEQAVDPGPGREGVGNHPKADGVSTERGQPGDHQAWGRRRPAPGRHPHEVFRSGGIVSDISENRLVRVSYLKPRCRG